jgi:hypothetical protein
MGSLLLLLRQRFDRWQEMEERSAKRLEVLFCTWLQNPAVGIWVEVHGWHFRDEVNERAHGSLITAVAGFGPFLIP